MSETVPRHADLVERQRFESWAADNWQNSNPPAHAWTGWLARAALSTPIAAHGAGAAEQFARWLEQGPKLAEAAGCYVAIKVTGAKP